jgi:hypothetical protein
VPDSPVTSPPTEYKLGEVEDEDEGDGDGSGDGLLRVPRPVPFADDVLPIVDVGRLSSGALLLPGLVSVVSDGRVFTVHDAWAGVGSSVPVGLTARTANECRPLASAT